jgi:transcription-repair coupling factor (superfamily II helicase)
MEMYKKISLIATEEDFSDIADEFIDRFGDMPRPVVRLLEVALMKSLSEKCGIERIEERTGTLTFVVGKPDLTVWSEVFSKYRGMRFAPSGDRVIYKCQNEEPTHAAASIVKEYYKALSE